MNDRRKLRLSLGSPVMVAALALAGPLACSETADSLVGRSGSCAHDDACARLTGPEGKDAGEVDTPSVSDPTTDGGAPSTTLPPGDGTGGSGGPLGDSEGPCPGCRVHVPPSYGSQPARLLVALHGDEGRDFGLPAATAGVIGLWSAAADAKGFIVFAPACPASAGCNGAWSDWLASEGYHPSAASLGWLDAQVDALEAKYDIARKGEYLAGHSGGAYWLGYYAQARASRFGGVAFVAGGMPAYTAFNACPTCKIPGYFLGGDGDPRTPGQMSDTASAFQSCGEEIVLDLVHGDHEAAIDSVGTGRGTAVLDWFLARPRACP